MKRFIQLQTSSVTGIASMNKTSGGHVEILLTRLPSFRATKYQTDTQKAERYAEHVNRLIETICRCDDDERKVRRWNELLAKKGCL